MKVLHLVSNWKWTGPVEPAVQLARGLREKGVRTLVAVGTDDDDSSTAQEKVRGMDLPLVEGVRLSKHLRIFANRRDAIRLAEVVEEEDVTICHCHMPNDHLIAAGIRRRVDRDLPVVRSVYEGDGPRGGLRSRFLLKRTTDRLICVSEAGARAAIDDFGVPADRVQQIDTAIDLERFDPGRDDLPDMRAAWGFDPDDVVLGIVSRIQPRRRYDVLLQAFDLARQEDPRLRLVCIGRGSHREEVAVRPAAEMGLEEVTRFPGFIDDIEVVGALRAFDLKVYLVPGTDGSARALREAMAMGLPSVVSRRGMLPEIVEDGVTGRVIEDEPAVLAEAILELADDADLRTRLGRAAREHALETFSLSRQASRVLGIYRDLDDSA